MAQHPLGKFPPFQKQEGPAALPISLLLPSPCWCPIQKDNEIPMVWGAWNRPLGIP